MKREISETRAGAEGGDHIASILKTLKEHSLNIPPIIPPSSYH
jgi:hypothetical protein